MSFIAKCEGIPNHPQCNNCYRLKAPVNKYHQLYVSPVVHQGDCDMHWPVEAEVEVTPKNNIIQFPRRGMKLVTTKEPL